MKQSNNTAARPSDAYPEHEGCGSRVFVDAVDYDSGRYYCNACDEGFDTPDGYTPPAHARP